MSDLSAPCAYRPTDRTGEHACPYTAGYWASLHRHRTALSANHRMATAVKSLDRLQDLDELLEETSQGDRAP